MAGSTYGTQFKITTWGESHGAGVGVVVDGCPAGIPLCPEDIQLYLNRRKPGQSQYSTPRQEADAVEILSGTFEGKTTGTPISLMVLNKDQHSRDYSDIAGYYRPGHADYTFDMKYGFRDYRGGGRSSGRETIGRVAAGAVAAKFLSSLYISFYTYSRSIGPAEIAKTPEELLSLTHEQLQKAIFSNALYMPEETAVQAAQAYLADCMEQKDSAGGVVECLITGVPAGIGDPVFEKLDARLAQAIFSIGAVKGFEIGDGFAAAKSTGSQNNDSFSHDSQGNVCKLTNHAGGILGGISDGSPIVFRAAFKPTPSISAPQDTIHKDGQNIQVSIKGRHDPIIVPRAVVVVEAMAALTLADLLMCDASATLEKLQKLYI